MCGGRSLSIISIIIKKRLFTKKLKSKKLEVRNKTSFVWTGKVSNVMKLNVS